MTLLQNKNVFPFWYVRRGVSASVLTIEFYDSLEQKMSISLIAEQIQLTYDKKDFPDKDV